MLVVPLYGSALFKKYPLPPTSLSLSHSHSHSLRHELHLVVGGHFKNCLSSQDNSEYRGRELSVDSAHAIRLTIVTSVDKLAPRLEF